MTGRIRRALVKLRRLAVLHTGHVQAQARLGVHDRFALFRVRPLLLGPSRTMTQSAFVALHERTRLFATQLVRVAQREHLIRRHASLTKIHAQIYPRVLVLAQRVQTQRRARISHLETNFRLFTKLMTNSCSLMMLIQLILSLVLPISLK